MKNLQQEYEKAYKLVKLHGLYSHRLIVGIGFCDQGELDYLKNRVNNLAYQINQFSKELIDEIQNTLYCETHDL